VGTSRATGIDVEPVSDNGTRRASCMTADVSTAWLKMGSAMVRGSSDELTSLRLMGTAMVAYFGVAA
jgi:hypothetical protein